MSGIPNPYEMPGEVVRRMIQDRQSLLRREVEDHLRRVTLDYEPRRERFWKRDYSSIDAFERSVEPNRRRWGQAVGMFDDDGPAPLDPQLLPFYEDDRMVAHWLTITLFPGLYGRAILALPKGCSHPVPLVIAQHGIGSSPERVFGLDDPSDIYKGYGKGLVEEGLAVLAPMNITEGPPRARYTRMALMLGKTLWGLEIHRTKRLLDYLEERSEVDTSRVGMYGISLGGAYTMFTTPLEPRIGAAVVCAWFNHRRNKMVVDDPRYSCFLSTTEEHIFIPGWLREFTDSDLVSLICPRPLLVEIGKCDGIAWWPQVLEEFDDACEHYRKLGVKDRIEMDLHEGGHEIRMMGSLAFLKKWLM